MIKHQQCEKEFKDLLKARFIAFQCETSVAYDVNNNSVYVKLPFRALQLYKEPHDLTENPSCQTEIFCPRCEKWCPIQEFEFYEKCPLCGKKQVRVVKLYCRKSDTAIIGCYDCLKQYCVESCPKRGLCDSYRQILYYIEDRQRMLDRR